MSRLPRAPRSPPDLVPHFLNQRQKSITSLIKFCHAYDCISLYVGDFLCYGSYVNVKVMIKISKLNENLSLDYFVLECGHYK